MKIDLLGVNTPKPHGHQSLSDSDNHALLLATLFLLNFRLFDVCESLLLIFLILIIFSYCIYIVYSNSYWLWVNRVPRQQPVFVRK